MRPVFCAQGCALQVDFEEGRTSVRPYGQTKYIMASINVFLTIDTEHSIGGAFADPDLKPVGNVRRIFGRIGGKEYGIPLQMEIADRFGVKLVFFVEVFNRHFFGADETRRVVETILRRGHDVQLHLHPNYLNFTLARPQDLSYSDLCGDYPPERQIEMLAEARQLLVDCGAPQPTAFRAGCFGANGDTLKALAGNGLLIDSSYNQAYLGGPCRLPDWGLNDLAEREGVFELPVTNFVEQTGLRSRRHMPLDINGVSFEEMRQVLDAARSGVGPRNVTVILHSFSFIKTYDVQYRRVRPRWEVIRRFEKLCRFLAENAGNFSVRTLGALTRDDLTGMLSDRSDIFPTMPARLSLARFGGQLLDRL